MNDSNSRQPTLRVKLVALVSGLVFALGLGISGMTNPNKVLAFLDVAGDWDPSLALVMAGAIAVYHPAFRLLRGRDAPLLAGRFHWPTAKDVDLRLVLGSVMFGVGWGLAGFCPGPAIVALSSGDLAVFVFFLAMVAGMELEHLSLDKRAAKRARGEQ